MTQEISSLTEAAIVFGCVSALYALMIVVNLLSRRRK